MTHQDDSPRPRPGQAVLRVTVLAGGPSAERAVSLESGRAVAEALRARGHAVRVCDVAPDDLGALEAPCDVVFPALHGSFGEDGQVQRILEERGIRFVGSGSRASALAMDKVRTKQRASALGIDTPEFEVVTEPRAVLAPPVVVKPVDQGSSVETSIVKSLADLAPALERVVRRFSRALVERFIEGDEVTVGILEGRPLPPIAIRPKAAFYDYHAKYHDDRTEYLFDAGLSADALSALQAGSLRLFRDLGCRHMARVDWMVDRAQRPWLLEVNTIPGFTSHSLLPKAAAHAGVSFEQLVDRLVRLASEDRE